MTEWKAKRFWKDVAVVEEGGAWQVRLDARPVRTPAKSELRLPTRVMAEAMAAEWAAQEGEIDPMSMPVTRSANAAIDRVAPQKDEVVQMLAAYAETDLLCHRADHPKELANRQAQHWDPLLDWAAEAFGARLFPTEGILAVDQPADSLARLAGILHDNGSFHLTALHDLVTLSGSLILGLSVAHGRLAPDDAWAFSRIDEDWQIEQWGEDEEALAFARARAAQFSHAAYFWRLSSGE